MSFPTLTRVSERRTVLTLEHETLTVDQQRWCADWLMQFLWAIENDVEHVTNLYSPPRPANPRAKGLYDPQEQKFDTEVVKAHPVSPYLPQPELWAYTCYIPPLDSIVFGGARVWLYPEEMRDVVTELTKARAFALWHRYVQGGTYQVWYYHRTHARMQLTPKARTMTGIEIAGEVLFAYFKTQILQDVSKRVLNS